MSFGPIRPYEGEWAATNPQAQAPRESTYIPNGSITNEKVAPGIEVTKLQGLGAKVYRSTAQTVTTGAQTQLVFDTAVYDEGDFWASGDATKLTAPFSGVYSIVGFVEWDTPSAGTTRRTRLYKNGTDILIGVNAAPIGSNTTPNVVPITDSLTAGDYLELFVYHDRGSDMDVNGGVQNNFLSVSFLFPI